MGKKIYTKTGDRGFTSLLGGTKVPKNDWRIESYGTVDELNSYIGLLHDKMLEYSFFFSQQLQELDEIQSNLFKIGSILSYDASSCLKIELSNINELDVTNLEEWMDSMGESLQPLKNFIIPGGHEMVSISHICRTVCRRAERNTVECEEHPIIMKYLNRLSDYFFILARFISEKIKVNEKIWKS